MYFDRIERSEVTEVLDSIYKNVKLLEDVQFLVQYAPQVLPPTVPEATGERIWENIVALQEDLTNKREVQHAPNHIQANAFLHIYMFVYFIFLLIWRFKDYIYVLKIININLLIC